MMTTVDLKLYRSQYLFLERNATQPHRPNRYHLITLCNLMDHLESVGKTWVRYKYSRLLGNASAFEIKSVSPLISFFHYFGCLRLFLTFEIICGGIQFTFLDKQMPRVIYISSSPFRLKTEGELVSYSLIQWYGQHSGISFHNSIHQVGRLVSEHIEVCSV